MPRERKTTPGGNGQAVVAPPATIQAPDLPAEPLPEPSAAPATLTTETALAPVPATQPEATEANLVLKAREEMRSDMASRLAGMMANLRSGLQIELVEFHSALRDATLQAIAARLEAINLQLAKPVSPLLKPSIRATLKEMAGGLAGIFLQMLTSADPDGDLQGQTREARAISESAIQELVPNSDRLG